jgi:hypothetical protein
MAVDITLQLVQSFYMDSHQRLSGLPGLQPVPGAASLVPLDLRLPASWTEQPPAPLALQCADGHCGTIQPTTV